MMLVFLVSASMAVMAVIMLAWSVRQVGYRHADIGRVFLVVLAFGLVAGIVIDGALFGGIALLLLAQSTLTVGVILVRSRLQNEPLVAIRLSDFRRLVKPLAD
jgi:hypothetical protein